MGKRSYILIDEYYKPLMDNYENQEYESIRNYETTLLSAGLKGNRFLKKALMTGVMGVSREIILSGLNNLYTYDIFTDYLYKDDFGLTEQEIEAVASRRISLNDLCDDVSDSTFYFMLVQSGIFLSNL